jgi:hypothetical protein
MRRRLSQIMRTLGGPRTQGISPYHREMAYALRLALSRAHSRSDWFVQRRSLYRAAYTYHEVLSESV